MELSKLGAVGRNLQGKKKVTGYRQIERVEALANGNVGGQWENFGLEISTIR